MAELASALSLALPSLHTLANRGSTVILLIFTLLNTFLLFSLLLFHSIDLSLVPV